MPLGFQRLNERVKRPNELINFIKPLATPDEAIARDYLERIAAIVYPVMKANYVAVMSLEEFPSNREFWGRNFNAGEVIQLVLKSPSGAWLPFRHVQMVMIHELAHCKEMNHSRFFWRTRNTYADELRALWQKGYTGEGFWSTGRGVQDGSYLRNVMPAEANMPENLCGGVYRTKGKRRRQNKPEPSWAERKQKRILKKFGAGGVALGGDDDERQKLEKGKKVKGKPRVAGSARARELRAAAALARFESIKPEATKTESLESSDGVGDSSETDDESCTEDEKVPTIKSNNKDMIRVCDGDGDDDRDVKKEQQELDELWTVPTHAKEHRQNSSATLREIRVDVADETNINPTTKLNDTKTMNSKHLDEKSTGANADVHRASTSAPNSATSLCKACSCENEIDAIVCVVCSNVLDPSSTWNHWRCKSTTCKDGEYINLGDYGRCQVCGSSKLAQDAASEDDEL